MAQRCPAFTYLLFADDLFLLTKVAGGNLQSIFSILEAYQRWSGLNINKQKISHLLQYKHAQIHLQSLLPIDSTEYRARKLKIPGPPSTHSRSSNTYPFKEEAETVQLAAHCAKSRKLTVLILLGDSKDAIQALTNSSSTVSTEADQIMTDVIHDHRYLIARMQDIFPGIATFWPIIQLDGLSFVN